MTGSAADRTIVTSEFTFEVAWVTGSHVQARHDQVCLADESTDVGVPPIGLTWT